MFFRWIYYIAEHLFCQEKRKQMFAFLFEIVYNETILYRSDMLYVESGNLFDYLTTSNLRLHTKMCSYPRLPPVSPGNLQ